MAMFERSLFNKPIAVTEQNVPSGVSSDITTGTPLFSIPWNRLGYLKRIEVGRGCNGASGCLTLELWDNFQDNMQFALLPDTASAEEIEEVSGFVKRKSITIPDGTAQMNWDETEDIPLLGEIRAFPSMSGVDITICARTM